MSIYKISTSTWYLERIIYLLAGVFTLVAFILGFKVSVLFFYLNALVGFMLVVFSLTGYCPMAIFLDKFGVKSYLKKVGEKE